ncbi:MAG TPA: OsmC family protein [Chitinophagaceae bacterium]|nr:OsmC family protein [Chitinophagaceae bacterium]
MKISARINNTMNHHEVEVQTNETIKTVQIPSGPSGYGSSVNGAELVTLALATCFCNDIYREAAKRNIPVTAVEVNCSAQFGADGEPGSDFSYTVKVFSDAPEEQIKELIIHTDRIAEIHNTLRKGVEIKLIP